MIIINGQFHEWVFLIYYMGKVLKEFFGRANWHPI